jgi:hypothetical protein
MIDADTAVGVARMSSRTQAIVVEEEVAAGVVWRVVDQHEVGEQPVREFQVRKVEVRPDIAVYHEKRARGK